MLPTWQPLPAVLIVPLSALGAGFVLVPNSQLFCVIGSAPRHSQPLKTLASVFGFCSSGSGRFIFAPSKYLQAPAVLLVLGVPPYAILQAVASPPNLANQGSSLVYQNHHFAGYDMAFQCIFTNAFRHIAQWIPLQLPRDTPSFLCNLHNKVEQFNYILPQWSGGGLNYDRTKTLQISLKPVHLDTDCKINDPNTKFIKNPQFENSIENPQQNYKKSKTN